MNGAPADSAIVVEELVKIYPITGRATDPLRVLFRKSAAASLRGQKALQGISLRVPRGASLGIIGRNGSGKSTLLRILSGTLAATSGRVSVTGRVAALLDLGIGISPDFTGRENAILLGVLAGRTRREVLGCIDEIYAFSGLEAAFERPVRTYSSGMVLRLAFSAAVHTDPDVLLIDETLAVGDAFFQQRCLRRIRELRARGCTILLVSHDPAAIAGFCDRALWLEHGGVVSDGDPARVLREYLGARYRNQTSIDAELLSTGSEGLADPRDPVQPAVGIPNEDHRYGDGRAGLEGVAVRDGTGTAIATVSPFERTHIVVSGRAREQLRSPIVGFTLRNRLGDIVTATNTAHEGVVLPPLERGDQIDVEFSVEWPPFATGAISVSPAIADGTVAHHRMCDWVDNAVVLEVQNPRALFGWLSLEHVEVRSACRRAGRTESG